MERAYLDHNATSPLRPEVKEAMMEAMGHVGNPNSTHTSGRRIRQLIDEARESVAALVDVSEAEVVFTSGGTEANHLAWRAFQKPGISIATSTVEHACVLAAADVAVKSGATLRSFTVSQDGTMDTSLSTPMEFISVQYANNETGIIYPVFSLEKGKALLHTDAVQAAGKIAFSMKNSNVDMLSLSGHKLGAPQGVGALIRRKRTTFENIWEGGPQEKGRRPGTENVLGIIGLGAAARVLLETREQEFTKITELRNHLEQQLLDEIEGCKVTGQGLLRLPNTSHMMFDDLDGESLMIAADLAGIDCSTGAACSSGSLETSHVLRAMGYSDAEAKGSIRFSLGWSTTEQEIEKVVECFPKLVEQVRRKRERMKK